MEEGVPQALEKAEPGDHPQGQQNRPGKLKEGGAHEGVAHHTDHPVQIVQVQSGDHDKTLGKTDAPVGCQRDEGDDRHEAQAAQLDHEKDHRLAKEGPGGSCIHRHKPRDAGGRGGSKKGVKKSRALPAPCGDGQGQQKGAH